MVKKGFVAAIIYSFLLSGCLTPEANYFNKALSQNGSENTIRYNPNITAYKFEGGTLRLDGDNLTEIRSLHLGNYPVRITKQNNNFIIGMLEDEGVSFEIGEVLNLFIGSAYGQSVFPLSVQINDYSITEKKIADSAIISEKIAAEAVTMEKISTADANDGDVIVYSKTKGTWIPGTIGGLGGNGNNVTSITIGDGLKTDGGDPTITSSGTIQVNLGHDKGQIIPLTENYAYPTGPGVFEHNGIIRAYAIDENSDGNFGDGDFHGQFSLVNTYQATSIPRFDYRFSFGGNTATSMVIKEVIHDKLFMEFDSNDGWMYFHQKMEMNGPVISQTEESEYDDFLNGDKDFTSDSSGFLDLNSIPLFKITKGLEVEDLHIMDDLFMEGALRVKQNAYFDTNVKIDGNLEVGEITGNLEVSGGLSVVNEIGDSNKIFNIDTDGNLNINNQGGNNLFSFTSASDLKIKDDNGDLVLHLDADNDHTLKVKNAAVEGVDYAEYFDAEETATPGDVIGLNLLSGKARIYRSGDFLLGVVSSNPGITGGIKDKNKTQILVGLMGQIPVNPKQMVTKNGYVYTLDNIRLGVALSNGMVYLNQSTSENRETRLERMVLEQKVKRLENLVSKLLEK